MAPRMCLLVSILVLFAVASLFSSSAQAQLRVGYYRDTCYYAEDIVLQEVVSALSADPNLAGSLLRLHFHDCFVRSHGPYWHVPTGRLDGMVSRADGTKDLPPPDSDITQLKSAFAEKNLTTKDLVVLSGAHTIGSSHCQAFLDRLNGSTTGEHKLNDYLELDPAYLNDLRSKCAADPGAMVQMSPKSFPRFDTSYYSYVKHRRGLFRSDAVLLAEAYVEKHATGRYDKEFFGDFGEAMVNMGNIQPASTVGEVRRKCSVVNDYY